MAQSLVRTLDSHFFPPMQEYAGVRAEPRKRLLSSILDA